MMISEVVAVKKSPTVYVASPHLTREKNSYETLYLNSTRV